jgi:hypothetical protein
MQEAFKFKGEYGEEAQQDGFRDHRVVLTTTLFIKFRSGAA